ncbi:MAG: methionyl-tRNA formyltransferase [Alistipes sp.]|nr:methionyl-tRNA formyltransferase [Alistipes sp.]
MDSKALRIVYMGTPEFAVAPLRRLVESGYQVVAVVTMPDKPAGRGLKLQESAVKRYAREAGLKILQPVKLKDPEFVKDFEALKADLGIVIAFRMLPEIIWAQPRLGTFNLHASLLPQYRGAAPINWAIINGEAESGVTTFMLNHEIDQGDMLCQRRIPIDAEDTVGSLHDKLMAIGTDVVVETVDRIATGTIQPLPQSTVEPKELKGAPKIFKETCHIDWSNSTEIISRQVRGLSPYPAAWSLLCSAVASDAQPDVQPLTLKIFRVAAVAETTSSLDAPGTLVTDGKSYLRVACGDGYLSILELQLSGKRRMEVAELLRGFKGVEHYRLA